MDKKNKKLKKIEKKPKMVVTKELKKNIIKTEALGVFTPILDGRKRSKVKKVKK